MSVETLGQNAKAAELITEERQIAVSVSEDLSIRAKIIDSCGLACNFCHNEGTPVAIDHKTSLITLGNKRGKSGRVSIFSSDNGVNFLPGKMSPIDPNFAGSLSAMQESLGFNELHLTGGEPTLHNKLPDIIRVSKGLGYAVIMTSNGEMGATRMQDCAEAGLEKINFSIFGTTPEELMEVQGSRLQAPNLAKRKIKALRNSIDAAANAGIRTTANIVMSDATHENIILRLIEDFDPRLEIRVLHDLSNVEESAISIYSMLARISAHPVIAKIEAGSSSTKVEYELPDGRRIDFKQIRPVRLPECSACSLNNNTDCTEGFYGIRLYVDTDNVYKVGVCIQRMDLVMDLDEFVESDLCTDVLELRKREYEQLQQKYAGGNYQ